MSSVRMCDNQPYCVNDPTGAEPWKRIFSDLDEDWSTGNLTVSRRDKSTGRLVQQTINQETCGPCTRAKLGVTSTLGDVEAAKTAKLDPRYIDWLERQTQIGPYAITKDAKQ